MDEKERREETSGEGDGGAGAHGTPDLPEEREEPDAFDRLTEEGIAAAERKEYAVALQKLERALELRPDSAEAHYNLGVLYGLMALDDIKVEELFEDRTDEEVAITKAIHHYERALELDPELYHAYNNLATLHAVHGSYKLAVQALEASLRINPRQPEIREELAELRPAADAEPNPIDCPACGTRMESVRIANVTAEQCPKCRGLWFDHAELLDATDPDPVQRQMDSKRLQEELEAHLRTVKKIFHERERHDTKLRCPICEEPMERSHFGIGSGVEFDRCPTHGVFIDELHFERCKEYQLKKLAELKKRFEELDEQAWRDSLRYNPFLSLVGLLFGWFQSDDTAPPTDRADAERD